MKNRTNEILYLWLFVLFSFLAPISFGNNENHKNGNMENLLLIIKLEALVTKFQFIEQNEQLLVSDEIQEKVKDYIQGEFRAILELLNATEMDLLNFPASFSERKLIDTRNFISLEITSFLDPFFVDEKAENKEATKDKSEFEIYIFQALLSASRALNHAKG